MEASVYILYSKSSDKFYIGSTELLPEKRLRQHLEQFYGVNKYTSKVNDWEIFHTISCKSIKTAKRIENHIKKNKSRRYNQNLLIHPEISQKLLEKFGNEENP